jgi:D-amino-acid dehydrogenase
MKVLVLGAGVIGVTTAYQLMKRGHEVVVIDQAATSASECSFANGGQLSYSHVEPWATPAVLSKIPKWLMKKNSPLVFKLSADPKMWAFALKFLSYCNAKKAQASTKNMMRLALYSKQAFAELDADTNLDYSKISKGTVHFFTDEKLLRANLEQAQLQKKLGCDFEFLHDRAACEEKDPALKYCPSDIVGGIFFPIDETGDVNEFSINLTKYLEKKGVVFQHKTRVEEIFIDGHQISGIQTNKGMFIADSYVVCLGAKTPLILDKIGIETGIYPMKGYSISVKITNSDKAPTVGITDQRNKIVFSRLGNIMRVAGTAEFAGYDDSITQSRIETLKEMAKESFPDAGDIDNATDWACLRPSTPDGSPIIGKSKYNNLFLNTGHGTLGWTLCCGSAKAIADVIDGKQPEISLAGFEVR